MTGLCFQTVVPKEEGVVDGFHGIAQSEFLEMLHLLKGTGANFPHTVGDGEVGQTRAIIEGFVADACHAVGDCE